MALIYIIKEDCWGETTARTSMVSRKQAFTPNRLVHHTSDKRKATSDKPRACHSAIPCSNKIQNCSGQQSIALTKPLKHHFIPMLQSLELPIQHQLPQPKHHIACHSSSLGFFGMPKQPFPAHHWQFANAAASAHSPHSHACTHVGQHWSAHSHACTLVKIGQHWSTYPQKHEETRRNTKKHEETPILSQIGRAHV